MRVLVTSAGGPAGNNVINCFKTVDPNGLIVGTDVNKFHLKLCNADLKYLVNHAGEARDEYVKDLLRIRKKHRLEMIYPQSDREIFVCGITQETREWCLSPSTEAINICRDKLDCNIVLDRAGVPVPKSKAVTRENIDLLDILLYFDYPVWVRGRIGAGGYIGAKCNNHEQLCNWVRYHWSSKSSLRWMASEFLVGRNYSWTGLMFKGKLIASALKERLEWLFLRIGTASVQKISHNKRVCEVCEKALTSIDSQYTGLAMIDLIEDKITEINAGRIGTTGNQYALMSKKYPIDGNDWYNNFPYLAYKVFKGEIPDVPKRNALPENLHYVRHLDMGYSIVTEEELKEGRC